MFFYWSYNKSWCLKLIKNSYFWVWILSWSKVEDNRWHVFRIQTKWLSHFDWLDGARFSFIPLFYYLFILIYFISQSSLWPNGWGGWSPRDPKVRGSTPNMCILTILFSYLCYFIFYFPFYYPFWFYYFNASIFIILQMCWTQTPFIFASKI